MNTTFYLPVAGIDPATIYGGDDITCISAEEIQRLSAEWGTDVMSQMRPATPEEMAEHGIYGHACTLWEIWTDQFEVRCSKGDRWTTDELLEEYVPTLRDLSLARADTDLIVRLINEEDSWDDDQYEALLELADRAGLDEDDYQDDDGDTDVHAFVCAIQDALGVDLGE